MVKQQRWKKQGPRHCDVAVEGRRLQGALQVPVLLLQEGGRPAGCSSSGTVCSPRAFLMLRSLLS